MTDPRVQAVAHALADPGNGLPWNPHRKSVLGLDMTPFAEIAVRALDAHDEEAVITTTIDPDAFTDGPLRPRWMP